MRLLHRFYMSSDQPSVIRHQRKKGKVVVVGAVGMDLQRSPFYEKEQTS